MMKVLYTLLLVFLFSISAVALLYFLQEEPAKNGFKRGSTVLLEPMDVLDLKFNSYYIKGLSNSEMFLGNYTAPGLFSCGYDLKGLQPMQAAFSKGREMNDKTYTLPVGFFKDRKDNFSVDGFNCYNREQCKLIFTYYYRNQFLCLDTNLKVLYTAAMIDTNSVAKIKLAEYEADGKTVRTMAKPALAVNKRGYSDGNFVFIESALAADNEDKTVFDQHVVLDVYSLFDGKYNHSIYLPEYNGKKIMDFAVKGDLLIALYDRFLLTYQLKGKEVKRAK